MAQTIKCKHCGHEIEVSEALTHQIEEQVLSTLDAKHKKELEDLKREIEETASKSASEEFGKKLEALQKEKEEEAERNKKLSLQVDELLSEIRALRRKDEERELEMKKRLLDEEEKIRAEALKQAQENSNFEILELKKQLEDTKKSLDQANSKLSQKSNQLRGEVLELDLEKRLREEFIYDEISGVSKGKFGADIIQSVRNKTGKEAGIILWETKRAVWTPSKWLPKLREDGRKLGATIVVLVVEPLPKDIHDFTILDGVVLVSYANAIPLATLLRRSVMLVASAKAAALNKDENLEMLYQYLQSDTFRHRFEAFAEGIVEEQKLIEAERAAMERLWKKREVKNQKLMLNVSHMYGELQGIMGESLADIKVLELPDGED